MYARGQRICLYYDGLNRLSGKHYRADDNCPSSPTYNVSYGYDAGTNGIGQRTSMTDPSGSTAWTYDLRGQVTGESRTISGVNYLTSWTYNSAGLVASQTYPGGEVVTSSYLPQLKLASLTGSNTYLVSASYDAAGRLSSRSLGNTLTQSFGYYGWAETDQYNQSGGGLKSIQTGTLQNLQYTHDAIGNILTISDLFNSQVQTFTYDDLNRLTSAAAVGGQNGVYSEAYTYNATTGNLASKGATTYAYNDANHDHAVTHLNSVLKYVYDTNGNQIQRNGNTLTYDAENRLVNVSGGVTATFVYDGDGNRVQGTVNGVTTIYVNSSYEVSWGVSTSYYNAEGQRIAMRKSGVVSYILPDHLGSTMITTNSSGVRTSEQWYKAFGGERYTYGTLPTDRQYTGQDHETGLDLYFYNARWYDDSLGRFISADTIIPQPGDPQAWDRYSYVRNSPINYTDPSGHFCYDSDKNEFSDGDCFDDMQQELLDYFLEQLESGDYTDLELMENLIDKEIGLNSNSVIALRAASEIVRSSTPSGFGWSYEAGSKFFYGDHTNATFDDSGFGDLADTVDPNQIAHTIGIAYIAAYQKLERLGFLTGALVWGNEFGKKQSSKQSNIDRDLGYIAADLGEALVANNSEAVNNADSQIKSYNYAEKHTRWWQKIKWPWAK